MIEGFWFITWKYGTYEIFVVGMGAGSLGFPSHRPTQATPPPQGMMASPQHGCPWFYFLPTQNPAAHSQSQLWLLKRSRFEHARPCLSILLPEPHYDIVDIPRKRASLPSLRFFINVREGKSSLISMKTIAAIPPGEGSPRLRRRFNFREPLIGKIA